MYRRIVAVSVLVAVAVVSGMLAGQPDPKPPREDFPPRSNPGGSPFAPGKEPSLTHTVKVFWTTADGMVTLVDVTATGSRGRPTQWGFTKGGIGDAISRIDPACDYHHRIAAARPKEKRDGYRDETAQGQGTLTVRVFGWTAKDFATPPAVKVRYLDKAGKVVGQTSVVAHQVPDKLKPKPKPKLNK